MLVDVQTDIISQHTSEMPCRILYTDVQREDARPRPDLASNFSAMCYYPKLDMTSAFDDIIGATAPHYIFEIGTKLKSLLYKQITRYYNVSVPRSILSFSSTIWDIDFVISYVPKFTLYHEFAHACLFYKKSKPNNIILAKINGYCFNRRDFRIASRLSFSPLSLLENLSELGIPIYQFNTYCCYDDDWTDIPDEDYCQISLKYSEIPIERFLSYLVDIVHYISLLKKLTVAAIQLQYITNAIRNRISRSPNPYKKEPPIGGVKIGGKQHDIFRHVAEILYLKPIFILNQAAVP